MAVVAAALVAHGIGSASPPVLVSADDFGTNWEGASNTTQPPNGTFPSLAFTWSRLFNFTGVSWHDIEPTQGNRDYTAIKAIIAWNKAGNPSGKIAWCPWPCPDWATGVSDRTKPATDPSTFAAFMSDAADQIGADIAMIEPVNEASYSGWYSGTQAQLIAQCNAGHDAWKAKRPATIWGTPSALGGAGPGYLKALLDGGLKADRLIAHLYPTTAAGAVDQMMVQAAQYRSILRSYPTLGPVCISEYGWGNDSTTSDADVQAAIQTTATIRLLAAGFRPLMHYSWNGQASNGHWGTLYDIVGNALTEAGTAYGQNHGWLVGANLSLSRQGNSFRAQLRRSGYSGVAAWNADASGSFTPPAGTTRYRDLAGNATAWSSGPVNFDTKGRPLLFETGAP